MAKSNMLNTRTINYLELIGNGKQYRVPHYQRDYSWKVEQWEDLWSDILQIRSGHDEQHYLGALVVEAKDDREFLVIDGQQRLATLSLLALAVVSTLEAMADDDVDAKNNRERSRELRNRFLGEKDPASLVESSRLHLNDTDNAFYQDRLIQLKQPLNLRRLPKSNQQLWRCYRYFVERIGELDDLHNDGLAVARLLSEFVARRLLFILITVDDELNAYTVFETLNARGLELTTTDLLKNYLLSRFRVSADLVSVQRRWQSLIETVGQDRFAEFLRYHLLCEQPRIRNRQLFKLVRDRTKTTEDVLTLLDALENRGELYAAIQDPNHAYWIDLPDARQHVAELKLFGVRQPLPLLFAAWESLSSRGFVRVLKLVSILSFRFVTVSGRNTNELEPVYHRAAKSVIDGTANTLAKIFEILKPIYVNDEKMRQDFALLMISSKGRTKRLVKYVLARLEETLSGRRCDPDTDPGTIEHVLPENPDEVWDETYPTDRWEHGTYRLGNLTLLESSLNREAGSKEYGGKVVAYSRSRYRLTAELLKMAPEEWTEALVDKRQKHLATLAVQAWRVDFV